MAEEFSREAVLNYIVDKGGKVTNHELVKHFKKFLSGPVDQAEVRATFKEFVNSVATIKQEEGVKYLVLKKRSHANQKENSSSNTSSSSELSELKETDPKKCKLSEEESSSSKCSNSSDLHLGIIHSHSSPSILGMAPHIEANQCNSPASPSVLWSSDLPPGQVPQPPPRRKHSHKGKENRGAKFEESIRQMTEEKEVAASPRSEEIKVIVSPGSVKEKAQKLNRMASEVDLSLKGLTVSSSITGRRREKCQDDDDACSVSTLDPRRKEWIIKASRCDYHELVRLLQEEPKLAHVKDGNSYTALHWAAKHGNLDVIKLMAGTHKLNTNARTSGGYTPLHLAAIFGREEIMEVLINTYGADPLIRDYSGKRPLQYLPKNQAERFMSLYPALAFPVKLCAKLMGGRSSKDLDFMRMGSLNSKVKKTSVLMAGGRALTRMKSWGSADSIQEKSSNNNLMPPPKLFPKRRKARKQTIAIGATESYKAKFGDSDSDSASGA